jgi:hypothetical protein
VTDAGGPPGPARDTTVPNDPWFSCLASCQAQVPCGQGWHTFGWEAGAVRLSAHPDAEAELVLAALGGDKPRCIGLAQAWARHADDLSVLAIGPRGPADRITVNWDDVAAAEEASMAGGHLVYRGSYRPGPGGPPPAALGRLASPPPGGPAAVSARQQQQQQDAAAAALRRNDMLSLLALGYGFGVRLAGQVAAAHADRLDERVRPALTAAITGRLALVAEEWLGIDPDQVVVSLHTGPGWGATELTGRGEERRLRVSLPARWLAAVWACGLALVDGHLVVAVERGGWPDARVLGVPAPGAEPVPLDVHARVTGREPGGGPGRAGVGDDRADAGDAPHWEV